MVRAINSPAVTWMERVSTRGDEDSPAERAAGLATSPKPISPVPGGRGSELDDDREQPGGPLAGHGSISRRGIDSPMRCPVAPRSGKPRDPARERSRRRTMAEQAGQVLPKSPIGRAIAEARARWADSGTYTRDGELSIDKNRSERRLHAQAVGRKNFLLVGSDRGARRRRPCIVSWPTASGSGAIRSRT